MTALQYAYSPRLIQWIFKIQWAKPEDLGEETAAFLRKTCETAGLPIPRIGIIEDGRPNAFTFGHAPKDARVVVTRGLLDMLSPDETNAVVAHELGHIRNWDFVVMSAASCVPLVLYILYVWTRNRREGGGYARMVGYGAYVAYLVSQYMVLSLSRIREYFADKFSATTTGEPRFLSQALVRIAYGLATLPPEVDKKKKKASANYATALGSLGIASGKDAAGFAVSATGIEGSFSAGTAARAMRWDLTNPWARWFELNSTHPLTARRIQAMSALSREEDPFRADLSDVPSYWEKFKVDFIYGSLPWLGFVIGIVGRSLARSSGGNLPLWDGIGMMLIGFGLFARLRFAYRDGETEREIASLAMETEVSHLRPIPVTLKGTVIGKGVPGLFYSKDLVLQDESGFVTLLYRHPIRLFEIFFGIFKTDDLIGKTVTAHGWYRRMPSPVVELRQAEFEDGGVVKCHYLKWLRFVSGALIVIGGYCILRSAMIL